MSKEAKVGLLLGLALIVGIVLVLRGLHANDDVKLDDELAISDQIVKLPETQDQESLDIPSAVDKLYDHTASDVSPVANDESDIRFVGESPKEPFGQSPLTVGPLLPPEADPLEKLTFFTEPVKADKSVIEVVLGDHQKAEMPSQNRIYVVEKGDCLEKIALRVYGKEEGKKQKHILGIYEANKDKMPSKHTVYPDQKLVIPRLPGEPGRVNLAAEKQITLQDQSSVTKSAEQVYCVQKYDNLWDIAEAKLGSGLRYKEIKKLNDLKNDKIYEGQKLRLPMN